MDLNKKKLSISSKGNTALICISVVIMHIRRAVRVRHIDSPLIHICPSTLYTRAKECLLL